MRLQGWLHVNPSEARGDNTWVSAAGTWGGEFHPEFGPKKYLLEREQVEERTAVVEGFNRRPHVSMSDFKIWSDVEPPKGTMYNYPVRPWQNSRPNLAAYPAPPEIAVQIFKRASIPTVWTKLHSGQSIPQVIAWGKDEVHGFMR
jgi:hypothetical protein